MSFLYSHDFFRRIKIKPAEKEQKSEIKNDLQLFNVLYVFNQDIMQ